jgi:hypothetical protein
MTSAKSLNNVSVKCKNVARKVLQPAKINKKYKQFFLWLVLIVLLATAEPKNNMFSRICAKGYQNGVVW